MKKVFAFLSTMLLTIAFVGVFAVNTPAKAAGKITQDPTLAADEIPVYIMDSIYTTFPNYYDNEAEPDNNWSGPSRMYPWNETRLRVAQFDENGNPTGKYYAVYFSGHTVAVESNGDFVIGAGKNILFYDYEYQRNEAGTKYLLDDNGNRIPVLDENGNKKIVAVKMSDGALAAKGGQASDPSLSHMRTNISGVDIEFNPTQMGLGDEGTNYYNRSIIFNAKGQVIRGIALDEVYNSAEGTFKFAPEYCYSNGVVTKIAEGVTCDKEMQQQLDEEGNAVLDEDGNPIMIETDKDRLVYSRFVWEYFTTKPENVNTVPYLSAGWDPNLWDYCYEQDGGYMCIAFVGSADNTCNVKGDQVNAYKQTLIGQGKTEEEATQIANSAVRTCVATVRIPAGGYVFDYGYLDKGKVTNDKFFNETVIYGYLYGRKEFNKVDKAGNQTETLIGMGEQRTYSFSVSDISFDEKVINDTTYKLLEGQNVVEIMAGDVYNPTKNINYNGVMRYWSREDDLTSYTSSSDSLEFYITSSKNGGSTLTLVEKTNDYTSMDDIVKDFLADIAAWKGVDVSEIKFDTAANFQSNFSWGQFFATNADNAAKPDYPSEEMPAFWNIPANREKWGWLIEKIYQTMLAYPGGDTYAGSLGHVKDAATSYFCGSPQTIAYAFWYFLNGQQHGYFGMNFQDGNNTAWMDTRSNLDKWNDVVIDASKSYPGENWVMNYRVYNSSTNISSTLTIKYVVVDSYTPVIEVNNNNLLYFPTQVGDALSIAPIDRFAIVKAYDAQYNGVELLGNDISQNIEFDTTLDWNNPTEGIHTVVATIWNNARTKKATKTFQVEVRDMTAPLLQVRNMSVLQGDNFNALDAVVYAYDVVDGNLLDIADLQAVYQSSKAIDTNKMGVAGKDRTETVTITARDRAGNTTSKSFVLTIVANKYVEENLMNEFGDLKDSLGELTAEIQDILDKVDALDVSVKDIKAELEKLANLMNNTATKDEVQSIKNVVDALKTEVDTIGGNVETIQSQVTKKGCGSGALLVLEIAGAAALLAVVLRKRH